MEPKYLQLARLNLGERESLGPNDSLFIRKMLAKLNGLWLKGQPWCGSAMAYWMQGASEAYPKDYYRALAWATWGEPTGPKLGAVAVLTRKGGGHVGIVTGVGHLSNMIRLLGANQGDKVCEAWFDYSRVTAFRKPFGLSLSSAPFAEVGDLSKSEA